MNLKNKIINLYHKKENPGSFSGVTGFVKNNSSYPAVIAKRSLEDVETIALHKQVRKNGPRRRVYCGGIDEQWHSDLIDLRKHHASNDKKQWILTIIDCFSKYAWAVPIHNKRSTTVADAFEQIILKSKRKCKNLQVDMGKEYYGEAFQKMAKKQNINVFSTFSEIKNSVCERFNRTLMEKISRYWTKNNTYRYVDALPKILESYNKSYHRSIKTFPSNVTLENESTIRNNLFPRLVTSSSPSKFYPNDICRLASYRGIFSKGYQEKWTREKFRIKQVKNTNPHHYILEALDGEEILGGFYDWELQKA
ncbi:Transposon TyH3 Gag-Pol polyprotein [Folsomia candida]|uniref:Transposon TyH3 Gag-Pol polyprotein n=1 Tax=Folsomia candida TaxID=158441 RepID=A0A226D9U8_FOLCA|nr:Transposon TyH3 Gag-Pol polyprotein [Folsomia candida]